MLQFAKIVSLAVIGQGLYVQAQTPGPAFEVASVKISKATWYSARESNAAIHLTAAPLVELILRAYGIKFYQLSNPSYLNGSKAFFDIDATIPPGSTLKDVPDMLKVLLAERLRVRVHWVVEDRPIYRLIAEANVLLKVHKNTPDEDATGPAPFKSTELDLSRILHIDGPGTMEALATRLSPSMDRPVIDSTHLAQVFDLKLDVTLPGRESDLPSLPDRFNIPRDSAAVDRGGLPSIFSALRRLGLRLEPVRQPMKCLFVDNWNGIPLAN